MMKSDKNSVEGKSKKDGIDNVQETLLEIETWAVYKLELTGLRLRSLLTGQELSEAEFDYAKAKVLLENSNYVLSIHDLDRCVKEWEDCIPKNPQDKARLFHLIGQKYKFAQNDIQNCIKALEVNTDEVSQAYLDLFNQNFERLYALKSTPDPRPFWFKIPEFLHPDVMKDLRNQLEWINLPWGETLFKEGDESDGLFIMVSGRLRIVTQDKNNRERVLEEVGRGDIFGEISVLSNETRRSASAYAVRDSEMVKMSGEGHKYMTFKHPLPSYQFTQKIIGQMKKRLTREHKVTKIGTIAVVPIHGCPKITEFIESLVPALTSHGSTLWMNSEIIQSKLGQGVEKLPQEDPASQKLNFWIGAQEMANRFLVLEADSTYTEWTKRCIRMADRILLVAEVDSSPHISDLEKEIYSAEFNKISPSQELIILHDQTANRPSGTIEWLQKRHVNHHRHIRLGRSEDFQKLGRNLSGKAIGLVFSGGGARGLAHVGVFRALQESGIPFDAVGGASFGAIIAACIGVGWDAQLLDKNMHEFVADSKKHFRITLPIVSIMDGKKLNRMFQHYYGFVNIEDLWIDTLIVSTNLSRSRLHTHHTGPLWKATRASMSIPGVFPPVVDNGELFVDGGVLNYMPADIMKAHLHGGYVIASDTKSKGGIKRYEYDNDFSPWRVALSSLNPFRKAIKPPNLVEVTALTVGAGEKQREAQVLASTDLHIDINADEFEMFGYDAIDDLIELGYETTMRKLETLDKQELLNL